MNRTKKPPKFYLTFRESLGMVNHMLKLGYTSKDFDEMLRNMDSGLLPEKPKEGQ